MISGSVFAVVVLFLTLTLGLLLSVRSSDLGDFSEEEEEDLDEYLVTNSPEPPEFVEPEDSMQTDENSQPGRLHPEQDLPHIFKVGASQSIIYSHLFHHRIFCFDLLLYLKCKANKSVCS